MYVAEASLFIAVSKLLWGFDIEYAKDEGGRRVEIDTLAYDGMCMLLLSCFSA
jgi:hypothetical protein